MKDEKVDPPADKAGENPPPSAPLQENPPPAAPAPAPAAPPAAKAVIEGETENEIALKKKLKDAELTIAQRDDIIVQLKKIPATEAKEKKEKKKPGIRWTLLHPREDED